MKNYSRQREELLEVLKNSYSHPTAEEAYEALKQEKKASSRSTVYRNLGILEKEDIIRKISIPNKPDRYDCFKKPHNHVICRSCGEVADFEYDFKATQIIDAIKEDTKMESSMDSIIIEAVCSSCHENA